MKNYSMREEDLVKIQKLSTRKDELIHELTEMYNYKKDVLSIYVYPNQLILSINKVSIIDLIDGMSTKKDKIIVSRYLSVRKLESIHDIKNLKESRS